jgi:hypothetical protein
MVPRRHRRNNLVGLAIKDRDPIRSSIGYIAVVAPGIKRHSVYALESGDIGDRLAIRSIDHQHMGAARDVEKVAHRIDRDVVPSAFAADRPLGLYVILSNRHRHGDGAESQSRTASD